MFANYKKGIVGNVPEWQQPGEDFVADPSGKTFWERNWEITGEVGAEKKKQKSWLEEILPFVVGVVVVPIVAAKAMD